MDRKKTIIMLCVNRSGSTAIYDVFRKHPEVGRGVLKTEDPFFEPNFWNNAARAIGGNETSFRMHLTKKIPYVKIPKEITKETVFKIWDLILEKNGPVIFDKTPFYLGNHNAINLILEYQKKGNDVRLFFLIRNPVDTITSQHELRGVRKKGYTIKEREIMYIERIIHMDEINAGKDLFPVFKYEEIAKEPNTYIPKILNYCGLSGQNKIWNHIKPVSIGRYWWSINSDIRKWVVSEELLSIMKRFRYEHKMPSYFKKVFLLLIKFPHTFKRTRGTIAKPLELIKYCLEK